VRASSGGKQRFWISAAMAASLRGRFEFSTEITSFTVAQALAARYEHRFGCFDATGRQVDIP
jgi:hypothetical protein